jgi:hypothetical protein
MRFKPAIGLVFLALAPALLGAGCAGFTDPPTGVRIYTPARLAQSPWIENEIRAFLGKAEVREALGFDPLRHESPITIRILEERLGERDAFKLFGRTDNARVSIKSYLFPEIAADDDGDVLQLNPKVRFDRRVDPHPQRRAMLTQLLADPDLMVLYRNLLVAHEVAHVGEWYALKQRGEVVQYTGHGISNRVEIRILGKLLGSGHIDAALFSRTLAFYVRYLNNEGEPPEAISAFAKTHLGSGIASQASTQADP